MNSCKNWEAELAELLDDDKFHDECGVVGISSPGASNIAKDVYFGLHSLQHRGQESAGIASNMFGNINYYKDMGLVQEVFNDDIMKTLPGDICIGHVRYSTAGESHVTNAQPLVVYSKMGSLALAHNGTLVNAQILRDEMQDDGYIFQTSIDTDNCGAHRETPQRQYCRGSCQQGVQYSKGCVRPCNSYRRKAHRRKRPERHQTAVPRQDSYRLYPVIRKLRIPTPGRYLRKRYKAGRDRSYRKQRDNVYHVP